jgi:hypothetical protein
VFYSDDHDSDFRFWRLFFIEIFFFISMVLKFFVDFIPDGENIPVRDIGDISMHYLKTEFLLDFIPLLPIGNLLVNLNNNNDYKLFYFLK